MTDVKVKKPRVYTAPIVTDPELEVAYTTVNKEAHDDYERRLSTLAKRIENVRALHLDPLEAEAAVQRVIADDTAANLEWAAKTMAAKDALDAVIEPYRFRSIGRKKFVELIDKNPPTDDDREEWDNAENKSLPAAVNELGFAKDLIAEASVFPKLSRQTVEQMFDDPAWNQSELTILYMVARNAQLQA